MTAPRRLPIGEVAASARRALLGPALADPPVPAPRSPEKWARPFRFSSLRPGSDAPLLGLTVGAEAVVELRDGRVYLGRVGRLTGCVLVLRGWGLPRPLRIPIARVGAGSAVPAHTWAERHAVVIRQAAGLPAAILPRRGVRS